MAHTVTGASLTPILERLNGADEYHPLDAETFADWSMEAGDIVTVTRDGTDYVSPVHTATHVWRGGAPACTINATGKQQRDPVVSQSKKKYGRGGAGMRNDQGLYYEIESEDGMLHTLIAVTASSLMTEVADARSDLTSQIIQTAGMIESSVATAESHMYTVIQQTATGIYNGVYDDLSGNFATIVQTSTMIATAVVSNNSSLYSTIQQTSTTIMTEVVKKNRTFVQFTDPALTVSDLHDGDIWVKSNSIRTWGQVANNAWSAISGYKWRNLYGSEWYVRKNGAWEKSNDESAIVENRVRVEHDEQHYAIIAQDVDNLGNTLNAKINVTAEKIESEVRASKSDTFSRIEQTASSIRMEVTTAKSTIWSSITQTSTQISLKVGKGEVISCINQTAESITIQASKINLSGYVQASDLTASYIAGILVNSSVLSTNYMFTKSLEIGTGGATVNGYSCALENGIWALDLSLSGNTYTLKKKHFYSSDWSTVGTFSRATTLSGAWGGTVAAGKYFKVEASPQGETCYSKQLDGMSTRSDKTWANDKKSFTQTIYVYDEDGIELYEENMSFGTTDSYNAGKADLSWSYGSLSHSNSAPSSYAKKYDVDTSYRYWYFNVTVNGVSKRILLDVLGI